MDPSNKSAQAKIKKLQELEVFHEEPIQETSKQVKSNHIENMIQETNKLKISTEVPSQAPTTFYSFEYHWRMLKNDLHGLSKFFKLISPENIPNIIKESLSSDILYSYIDVILNVYLQNNEIEYSINILRALTNTPRFKLQLAFLTEDKRNGM